MTYWEGRRSEREVLTMREILFRGKRLKDGAWIEGFYCEFANNMSGEQEHFIQTVKSDGRIDTLYHVDPSTVGQYTGKTVTTGKVFDGDIGRSVDGHYLVCWDEKAAAFVMRFDSYPYETLHIEEMWDDAEIIGNIHDNPELMEVHNE